jgi:hypothetical protein
MLQEGEIDHRQREGSHSDHLYEYIKDSIIVGKNRH